MSETTKGVTAATVRFGPGHISTPNAKSSPFAILSANFLALVAISCASLGLWRLGTDLDLTGNFVFQNGFLSHSQVWIGLAVAVQYTSWRLTHCPSSDPRRENDISQMAEPVVVRATANLKAETESAVGVAL
jgi:hypothetical protein